MNWYNHAGKDKDDKNLPEDIYGHTYIYIYIYMCPYMPIYMRIYTHMHVCIYMHYLHYLVVSDKLWWTLCDSIITLVTIGQSDCFSQATQSDQVSGLAVRWPDFRNLQKTRHNGIFQKWKRANLCEAPDECIKAPVNWHSASPYKYWNFEKMMLVNFEQNNYMCFPLISVILDKLWWTPP